MLNAAPSQGVGLAVALGAGLLIGIERERRKGRHADREAAGLRTFAVAALAGAVAQALPVPGLVPIGAALVAGLAAIAYFKSRSDDPGLTTELALFATYLIGVQAMLWPALAAACAAGLGLLLAARDRLHRFATELLKEHELHDGLLLAALALIVLPLVPADPVAGLGGIRARPLAALVLLILALQAGGQVALRAFGARAGLLAAGFVSGFVSSTATVASLGSRARAEPQRTSLLADAAALSAVATWVQAMLLSVALAPAAAMVLLPVAAAGAGGTAATSLLSWRRRALEPALPLPNRSALRIREALAVASMLAVVTLVVGSAQQRWGQAGLLAGVAMAALADAHAPVASLAALHAASRLDDPGFVHAVLIAVGANTLTRCTVAAVAGGRRYVLRVGVALCSGVALAAVTAASLTL